MKPLPQARLKPQGKATEKERSHSGIFLGEKCYWNPANLRNGHAVVLGTSGSGKTQTLKSMAYELPSLFPEIKVILIDLHGDLGLPNEVCYRLDAESPHGLNPLVLDLDPRGGGPDLQSIGISSILRKSLKMGDNQQGLLLNCFISCYENRGVEDGCKDSEKLLLKMAATFKYGIFSKPQPSLDFPLVRFDLSALAKVPGLSAIAAETLLKQLLDSHKLQGEIKDKTPRCYVILDECKEVKSSDTLARISAEARKFGLCAVVASQRDAHISGEVLANSSLKLVLAVDETEIASVKKRFRFSETMIASLQPLEALVRMDGDGMKTKILPYYLRIKQ
ncbi:MAG: cell division protein FtsK [Anabaena sp. AL09]|nr:MAG: cell division protein FtsK [Anabaena sp. AL09]